MLCSERIFIADGFAFYSSRPRTAGDPCAVPSFPQGRIFTQILQNRNEKRTEHSIEFNRKVFRKRQSCAPCKCLRLCRSRGVLPVCERERDRSLHWNRCPSPLESADRTRSLDYANRRLQSPTPSGAAFGAVGQRNGLVQQQISGLPDRLAGRSRKPGGICLDLFGSWAKIACELNVCEAGGDEPNALIRTVFGLDFPHESSRQ